MNKSPEDIIKELQAPFKESDIDFKVGATNKEKTMGLALFYVQARAIQRRLDEVVGFMNWKVSYREVQGGFLCCLSLRINGEWITKEDGAQITEYESVKGGISSAFKRVASSGFAIGRYLYDAEPSWYPIRLQGKGYEFTINPIPNFTNRRDGSSTITKDSTKPENKLEKARLMQVTFGKYNGKADKKSNELS
ncbi:hypothetical protein PM10SUCC1_33070 [Propionigenium maris DSM 9537]|uniref:Rad52/22 family double-strand break repair protein n=1 Tax=Propionigenium maris DSM 9537 TaxID=1123000 RepID=A0A9W6GNH3_9FUSO|nr:Rad52/Rad22 family DNA repair protein [Propionigenium maris]GLI57793.1 hypothetical protein PM10SUCC1_33070 [Propionigenium maris DSM 9537]